MKLQTHHFELPLKHPFRISRETITVQPTVVVELQADGCQGFGEATTNAYYGITLDKLLSDVERVRETLATHSATDPEALWQKLSTQLPDNPFALCAIDQAAHDLSAKLHGVPLYRHWGLDPRDCPASNFTIGIDEIDRMVAKMQEMPGWPIYKIKLGTDRDLDIIRALREHTSAIFRVDANCGWTAAETIANAEALSSLGVEFIEQPLPAADHDGQRQVFAESVLPIIADESCIVEQDVEPCSDRYHGINIKLTKCGGLTPARRMIEQARQLGLKVMVGCMTESTVGISAIAQLLPLLDYVDMDGAALLGRDIASGVRVINGICHFAEENGTGAKLLPDADQLVPATDRPSI
ncbi:MAG: dipeptide epimerase [Planctomycetales bacterium]|nr:dipeptide epimerase [Planctomycetales bacterium]